MDVCEFKGSLVYKAKSRTVRATQRHPVSKNKKKIKRERTEKYVTIITSFSELHTDLGCLYLVKYKPSNIYLIKNDGTVKKHGIVR